jgi:uncharacterized membrane protein YbaN (DUF454 family)
MMKNIVKALYIIVGTVSIVLGIIGIILPLLPTTPLLLLGAACYIRGSERLYQLLVKNKWLGTYIEDFRTKKGISLKNKVISLSMLWLSIGSCLYFVITMLWHSILLVVIALAVTIYILSFKTL